MPKVFIPNKGAHDYSDAERFGDLTYVTKGSINSFAVGTMARVWAEALETSTKDDWIMLTSLTTLCVVGCSTFALKHGQLNLLIFRKDRYIPRRLMLDQLQDLEGVVND